MQSSDFLSIAVTIVSLGSLETLGLLGIQISIKGMQFISLVWVGLYSKSTSECGNKDSS